MMQEEKSGTITLHDGTGIHYITRGNRRTPALLFIHGRACSSRYWTRQLHDLSPQYYTMAIDLRGHGDSDKPPSGYTLAQMAVDLHEVVERLDLHDLFMVGWSMGGSIIFEYLQKFGEDDLKGLALVGVSPCRSSKDKLQTTSGYTVMHQEPSDEHSTPLEWMFLKSPAPTILDQLKEDYRKVPNHVRSLLSTALSRKDYRFTIREINLPVLIMKGSWHTKQGKEDPVSEWMHRKIGNSRLIRFSESGHCPFLEEPENFNRVLSEFIEMCE